MRTTTFNTLKQSAIGPNSFGVPEDTITPTPLVVQAREIGGEVDLSFDGGTSWLQVSTSLKTLIEQATAWVKETA